MILITGATGYIGSHTWVELLNCGYQVVGVDSLINSNPKVLNCIRKITNQKPIFFEADVRDSKVLLDIFNSYQIDAVIHFAALKAVGESVKNPIDYYQNNLDGLLTLSKVMNDKSCTKFIFSSSATVYHQSNPSPYLETMLLGPASPYGWTKYMSERILQDIEISNPCWRIAYLRYFNPVGAHPSGLMGEDPKGVPNNLMPYVAQVAIGKRDFLSVYGGDWPTYDGTGVRDFIHVVDLARGHLKALNYLLDGGYSLTVNLGTGNGYSVLDLIKAFEKASKREVPYKIVDRRSGDIAVSYAEVSLAREKLDWSAEYDLNRMCEDVWRWQSMNPNGYE